MIVQAHLIINSKGKLRATKHHPHLAMDEVAVRLNIDMPNALFHRPIAQLNFSIPESVVMNPDAELAADTVAPAVATVLKLDVKNVTDGLVEMLKAQQKIDSCGQ